MEILTEKELAERLELSAHTIRTWRLKAGLPYFGTAGRIFYRWSSVEAWMSEQEAKNSARQMEADTDSIRIIA